MVNVGIAGLGFMGMTHYLAYQKVRGAKVVALCEKDRKRLAGDWRSIQGNFGPRGRKMDLEGILRYDDLDELMADPSVDLVDVCLPPGFHADVTVAALRAGKHVFCEKPIALNTADAKRMVRAAEKSGQLFMIGQVLPFFPEYRFAYETITSGKYGKPIGGHFKRIISDPLWMKGYFDPGSHGGPMIDLHVHDAHFIRLVFGMPKAVHSVGSMRGPVAERFTTQFLFDDPGLVVTASSGVIDQQGRPFTHGYEINLKRATLVYDGSTMGKEWVVGYPVTLFPDTGKVVRPKFAPSDPTDAFVAELRAAVQAVRQNAAPAPLKGDLARDALVLCQKQTQSLQRRRAVKV